MTTVMSKADLAGLGRGVMSYIRTLSADQAREMFPMVTGLPEGVVLYSLHAADGTPLALTDTLGAVRGHAIGDDLEIVSIH